MKSWLLAIIATLFASMAQAQLTRDLIRPNQLIAETELRIGLSANSTLFYRNVPKNQLDLMSLPMSCYGQPFIYGRSTGPIDNPWSARTPGEAIVYGSMEWAFDQILNGLPVFRRKGQ